MESVKQILLRHKTTVKIVNLPSLALMSSLAAQKANFQPARSKYFSNFFLLYLLQFYIKKIYFRRVPKLRKATINLSHYLVCPSLCLCAWNICAITERILIKFNKSIFFENLSRNSSLLRHEKNNGYFRG